LRLISQEVGCEKDGKKVKDDKYSKVGRGTASYCDVVL